MRFVITDKLRRRNSSVQIKPMNHCAELYIERKV